MGKLFGSSGVRGVVNVALTPQLACNVGSAVATYAHAKRAVVGRDTRTAGPMLEDALVAGLMAAGVEVSLLGAVPTPAVAYLTKALKADAGFMITASHNPPQYNGIKVFSGNSLSYTSESQNAVERIITENRFAYSDWRLVGKSSTVDLVHLYIQMLQNAVKFRKRWRIVVDPGCGATFYAVPAVLNLLGCKVSALNAQPDGTFPARSSEPNAESLSDLEDTVKALNADLGVAFDGDGDRVAFVDNTGAFVDFDRALAAFGAYVLKNQGGGTMVTNVEASMCVETMAERFGGKVVRSRVGDVYISEAMARENAVFGGEPCGAWVHPAWHWCPDGPLSMVLVLQALEELGLDLRDFIAEVPEYVTLRENIPCKNGQKKKTMLTVQKEITSAFPGYTELATIDGIRLTIRDGWILVRASGTEPLIRLTVEGQSLNSARSIMDRGLALVNAHIGETNQ